MTRDGIENTLRTLAHTINKKRCLYGYDIEIRVRIGRELAAWIRGYNQPLIVKYACETETTTIFGCPVEIDHQNTMCLEVCIVERVTVDCA